MKTGIPSKAILAAAAVGLLVCSLGLQARAAGINGTIDFGTGTVTYDTMSLGTATEVKTWNNVQVNLATGDFATFAHNGDVVTMVGDPTGNTPWVFNLGTPGAPLPGPATSPLWQVDGFTFDLMSSTISSQSSTFLNIKGPGTITGNGFDPTPGTWSFTSTNSSGEDSTSFTFTTDTASAIPEPTTWLAAALASCMVAYSQRRKLSRLIPHFG
jgi:hypothetical protein